MTRANGQPAFGMYLREPGARVAHSDGVMVPGFTLTGGQIGAVTRFDTGVLPVFGLPPARPAR